MKTLLFFFCLQFLTDYSPTKELHLNVKFLPQFSDAFKGQSIKINISAGTLSLDTLLVISERNYLTIRNINSKFVFLKITTLVKLKDSTEKYFWTGERISFEKSNTTNQFIIFPEDCEINKYYGGKTCPKCNKTDKAIPVIWGLPSPYLPGEPGVDYNMGGCIRTPCEPTWLCKRDSLHF